MYFSLIAVFFLLLCDIILEISEVAILVIKPGYLKFLQKNNEISSGVFFKIMDLKNNIKNAFAVILILGNTVDFLLHFFIIQLFSSLDLNYWQINIFSVLSGILVILFNMFAKHLGAEKSDIFLRYFVTIFYYLYKLILPLSTVLSYVVGIFFSPEKNNKQEEIKLNKQEIFNSLAIIEQKTQFHEEIDMAKSALLMRETTIEQIMTHKSDFVGIVFTESFLNLKNQLKNLPLHNHILVYENEDREEIIGTIDIYKLFLDYSMEKKHPVPSYITKPKYFLDNSTTYNAFKYFQNNKDQKLLLIIDEDGNICGLITMSDIAVDILGDIESDVNNYYLEKHKDGYLIEGNYNVRALNRRLDINLSEESSTLGGLLIDTNKKLPKKGDVFQFNNIKITIQNVSNKKIETIFLQKTPPIIAK